ncbi:hypothetical protein AAFN60_12270 [Roseibacillus persicicus]|uniref:Uncharacterized protein n=1 Tax=Roseibacillus persicicus TaxID=454148 RepID=A0A918WK76_9BACT|nr:hypothetical protein [Roseibacillus persicicus]GHC59138.1 hypothetical protein GCM10007100_27780 [Roseibacillus persicicus]
MSKSDKSTHSPAPEDFELSHDQELWDLLGNSTSDEASPLFSRNVMREIRLEESEATAKVPFWRALLTPRCLVPSAMALALVVAWPSLFGPEAETDAQASHSNELPAEVVESLEISLESELLIAAADKPGLFSDEEVIAMLF